MTKKLTSPRHPNWIIEKSETSPGYYYMTHKDFDGYMIEVNQSKDGYWFGEILTEQKLEDIIDTEWLPAQTNPMYAPIEKVKAEVVRRGAYWKSH